MVSMHSPVQLHQCSKNEDILWTLSHHLIKLPSNQLDQNSAMFLMEKIEGEQRNNRQIVQPDSNTDRGEREVGTGIVRKKITSMCKEGAGMIKGQRFNKQVAPVEPVTKDKHKHKHHSSFWKKKHHTKK